MPTDNIYLSQAVLLKQKQKWLISASFFIQLCTFFYYQKLSIITINIIEAGRAH
jgi:hypothetical protein